MQERCYSIEIIDSKGPSVKLTINKQVLNICLKIY